MPKCTGPALEEAYPQLVRHELVARIVQAYDNAAARKREGDA